MGFCWALGLKETSSARLFSIYLMFIVSFSAPTLK